MKLASILTACVVVSGTLVSCGDKGAAQATYRVGGTVAGLSGTVVLQNNGADDLSVAANGVFTFPAALADGAAYAVTVKTQPAAQRCTVAGGAGAIAGKDVTGVAVTCSSGSYVVGGTVSGLSGTVVLQSNGADDLSVSANGAFAFATALADGAAYAVTVKTQPAAQLCTVTGGVGTIAGRDVTSVAVTCSTDTYSVGGTVSGLAGALVLRNNGADDLSLSADGAFVFATKIADGSPYAVTVRTKPAGQACYVENGAGTVDGADVTGVEVSCHESGTLDDSFGTGGVVIHDFPGDSEPFMAIGPSGRIVLAGEHITGDLNHDMLLRVFTEEGAPDATFNSTGAVTFDTPGGTKCEEKANAVTFDGAGKIVAAGYSSCSSRGSMAAWRYNADGTPDATFGGDGFVSHGIEGSSFYAYAVSVDAGGRILATGVAINASYERDLAVWRYNADGSPDATFDADGYKSFHDLAGGNGWDEGYGILTDASGRILVTGHSDGDPVAPASFDMVILRLLADGTPDTSFGGDGIVSHHDAAGGDGWDTGWEIALDGAGRILVAGSSMRDGDPSDDDDMVIWRYAADGTLDATFGSGGVVVSHGAAGGNGMDKGFALAVDGEGRVLVTGLSDSDPDPGPSEENYDMATWRFNPDGTPDTSFFGDGIYTYAGTAGAFTRDAGTSIAIDRLGRIVVGGGVSNGSNEDGAIWRFHP